MTAEVERVREAREWAGRLAGAVGLDEDACFAVRLAVSEGVTNAILHGSASAEDLIELEGAEHAEGLVIEIRDPGTRGPEYAVDRVSEGGRGLDLVALVTDAMQLTRGDSGSVLRFVKHR